MVKKNLLIIKRIGDPRNHPELINFRCSQNCIPKISQKLDSQPHIKLLTPCKTENCDLKLRAIGHSSSGLTESLKNKFKSQNREFIEIEGYGKNKNKKQFLIENASTNKNEIAFSDIKYIDEAGTTAINNSEISEILEKFTKDDHK